VGGLRVPPVPIPPGADAGPPGRREAVVPLSAPERLSTMLTRWNPFEEMQRLQDEAFRTFGGQRQEWRPAVDIHEDEQAIKLMAELPGVRQEDVSVEIEDNVLTLTGERKLEHEDKREGYHRIERAYGAFSRSFVLPRTVDTQGIEAQMREGTLTVRLPKRAETQPRRIDVKAESESSSAETSDGPRQDVPVHA
jgi:HSP20 family protein